jgi:hypothetical protein
MPCEPHQVAPTSWSIAIPATVAIVAAVLLYLRGWRRLRKGFPDLASGCRPAAFVGGMLVLWIVIGSPLSGLDHKLLMFHMVQHLLLMTVAAPLILLGTAGVALSRGVPSSCGTSHRCSSSECARTRGTRSSMLHFSQRGFSSGGPSSMPGPAPQRCPALPCPCICSSQPCLVTLSPRFSPFAVAWFIHRIDLRTRSFPSRPSRTKSARAP